MVTYLVQNTKKQCSFFRKLNQDLPEASFAGPYESFMNVRKENVVQNCLC